MTFKTEKISSESEKNVHFEIMEQCNERIVIKIDFVVSTTTTKIVTQEMPNSSLRYNAYHVESNYTYESHTHITHKKVVGN